MEYQLPVSVAAAFLPSVDYFCWLDGETAEREWNPDCMLLWDQNQPQNKASLWDLNSASRIILLLCEKLRLENKCS